MTRYLNKNTGIRKLNRISGFLAFWFLTLSQPRSLTAGYIHIYQFVKDGKSLELLHKTQVDGVPLALCQFQGRLLAGIGSILRLYDLGKRRLL
ncbi:putative cleavage/polyadenylation specificity factor, A subunit [Helianthus annuus]|uniref:Cleavage/polyadenylation specificity factor, A subunit n=1 Tax=Helianthus annuus TaxID=4232 RepID=A0A9K3IHJ1_HELAN|nr:putative cleavage/polyadenylation specificity factor, A subunit [Helianthus annuus]KAJ0903313.1 putative cleavage/polyadenylation specificity factor, A subunit [Helianthus annuus]